MACVLPIFSTLCSIRITSLKTQSSKSNIFRFGNHGFSFESFPKLNLPPVELRVNREGGILKVYDSLRKKFVALTPEEFVRQHFVSWLISSLHYPPSLMANEIGIDLNGTKNDVIL